MGCENRVEYYVPKGYDYKALDYKCGSTGIDGQPVMCKICQDKIASGKMSKPGHCKHGTPLMDDTDSYDITCTYCERGE